jgi:hypothetical protein
MWGRSDLGLFAETHELAQLVVLNRDPMILLQMQKTALFVHSAALYPKVVLGLAEAGKNRQKLLAAMNVVEFSDQVL